MTREINFRAWDKKNKLMIREVYEICFAYSNNSEQWLVGDDTQTDYFELMQYTGLKDKNEKKIYEGDIIKITYETEYSNTKKSITTDILFDRGGFRYRHSDGSASVLDFNSVKIIKNYEKITQDVEVIGNIYENPELLTNNK